jgi:hypothetical protein
MVAQKYNLPHAFFSREIKALIISYINNIKYRTMFLGLLYCIFFFGFYFFSCQVNSFSLFSPLQQREKAKRKDKERKQRGRTKRESKEEGQRGRTKRESKEKKALVCQLCGKN